jgi:hypothetical protein
MAEAFSEAFIYGALEVEGNLTETVITTAGVKVQISNFLTSDLAIVANGTSPEFREGHIVIESDGAYLIGCSLSVERSGGAAFTGVFECYKNNGTTHLLGLQANHYFTGAATQPLAVSMIGISELVKDDTVEIWVTNETNTVNVLATEVALTVVKVSENA